MFVAFVFQYWGMDKSGTKENDSVDQSKDATIVEVRSPVEQTLPETIATNEASDESSGISLSQVSIPGTNKH